MTVNRLELAFELIKDEFPVELQPIVRRAFHYGAVALMSLQDNEEVRLELYDTAKAIATAPRLKVVK